MAARLRRLEEDLTALRALGCVVEYSDTETINVLFSLSPRDSCAFKVLPSEYPGAFYDRASP